MKRTPDPHRPRVLLVDRDDRRRTAVRLWLVESGFATFVARDRGEALALLRRKDVDVVVANFNVPGRNPIDFAEGLRASRLAPSLIWLIEDASHVDLLEALRRGRAFDFMEHSDVDAAALCATIEAAHASRPINGGARVLYADSPAAPPQASPANEDDPLMTALSAFVTTHLDTPLRLPDVAAAVGYNADYLTNLVRRRTGRTLARWILELRMNEARRLLAEHDWPIARIARTVGYADPGHFTRWFRKETGLAPSAWRDRNR